MTLHVHPDIAALSPYVPGKPIEELQRELGLTRVIKLASNNRVFERMANDIDISAGNVIDGTESIEDVGARLFDHVRSVASGETLAKAEILKHREFQFWAEQTVSL